MVRIYTSLEKIDTSIKDLQSRYKIDNEALFRSHTLKESITKEDEEVMKKIDNAEIIEVSRENKDSKDLLIKTPYGVTTIENLSTGCKTVLNFLHLKDNNIILDITECGWNALEELFKYYEDKKSSIILILRHKNYTYNCSKRQYIVNGKEVNRL